MVHLGSIQSYSIDFGPLQSSVVHFDPIWSCSDNLNLFSLFNPLWSYSVLFNPLRFYSVHSVHFAFIWSIRSYSAHFGSIQSILSTLILFSLLWSYLIPYVSHENIYPKMKKMKIRPIKIKDISMKIITQSTNPSGLMHHGRIHRLRYTILLFIHRKYNVGCCV